MTEKKNIFLLNPEFPYCLVQKTNAQSIPHNAWTTITYNQLISQNELSWDFTNNNLTIAEDGLYSMSCVANYSGGVNGRYNRLMVNGAAYIFNGHLPAGAAIGGLAVGQSIWLSGIIPLYGGDVIQPQTAQLSGGALALAIVGIMPYFGIVKISEL